MKKNSIPRSRTLFLAAVLLFAAAVLLGYQYLFPAPQGQTAHISVDGKEIAALSLKKDQEFTVNIPGGGMNHLVIEHGQIWCDDADCPDKLCVRQGKKQLSTDTIIRKPHKMAVTITGED